MACQFGPHTVRAHAVSPIGDRMLCVTPPYGRPGGGFTAVGLTISSLDAQLYSSADADAARGRAVVSPRGAQGFEYTPTWITRAARPSESDANGGAVLTVVGAHLQTAGACAFGADVAGGVRLAGRAATHVVSSALIRCEVPKREVGDGSLTLASETPEEDAARRARGWGAPALVASPTPYDPEDEVPGLALTAVRVPVVSDVTVGDASDGGGAATITMWGAGFDVGGSSRAAATGAAAAAAASEDDADAETETRAPPRRNAGGCRVGTTWVAAATTSRVHASCVIPWRAPSAVRVPVAYHDMRDHATGGAVVSSSSGENAFTFNPQSAPHALALVPSAAPTDGDTIVYVFGELGMGGGGVNGAGVASRSFQCDVGGGGGGDGATSSSSSIVQLAAWTFACYASPRGPGFVAAPRASSALAQTPNAATDAVFAYARAPVVRRLSPAEGGGVGGEPIWISGADLHLVGDTRSPSSVLCLVDDRVAVPARVVSSALASCERPRSASTGGGGSGGETRSVRYELGSHAIGFSRGGRAFDAWPPSMTVTGVEPRAIASGGGTAVTLRGKHFASSPGAAACRFGSVGPVAASTSAADALTCVSPAAALSARGALRVYGPVAGGVVGVEGHGVHVIRDGGDVVVGGVGVFPARASSAGAAGEEADAAADAEEDASSTAAATGGEDNNGRGSVAGAELRAYATGATSPLEWLAGKGNVRTWCVFDASQSVGGASAAPAYAATGGAGGVACRAPLGPPGFAALRIVALGGSETTTPTHVEFAQHPVVQRLYGPHPGEPSLVVGSPAVMDVVGGGFFHGLSCAWNGVARAPANVVSSAAARCEWSGVGVGVGVGAEVAVLGLAAGNLGASGAFDGPVAATRKTPAVVAAIAPSTTLTRGGTSILFSGHGFVTATEGWCHIGTIGPIAATRVGVDGTRCVAPARAAGSTRVAVAGAVASSDVSLTYVSGGGDDASADGRRNVVDVLPSRVSAEGGVASGEGVAAYADDGALAAACVLFGGGGGGDDDATTAASDAPDAVSTPGRTWCGALPPAPAGFTVLALTTTFALAKDAARAKNRWPSRADAAAAGEIEIVASPSVSSLMPRDAIAGVDEVLTLHGANMRRGDGAWCAFGDGAATAARALSSAVTTCELPPPPASRSVAAASAQLAPVRRRVDLTPTRRAGASTPCTDADVGAGASCVAFKHYRSPGEASSAAPASIPSDGGVDVALRGRSFPDAPKLGCRFGSVGPIAAAWENSERIACVAPGMAPRVGVRVGVVVGGAAPSVTVRSRLVADAAVPGVSRRDPRGASVELRYRYASPAGVGVAERDEAMTCRMAVSGAASKAVAATTTTTTTSGDGGFFGARCVVPPNPTGDGFDVVAIAFAAEATGVVVDAAGGVTFEYVEDAPAVSAQPSSASAEGGGVVFVVSVPGGARGFALGADRGDGARRARCVFGGATTDARIHSSALASCETPHRATEGVAPFDVVVGEAVSGGDAVGSFAHAPPAIVADVFPAATDWLSGAVLTLTGRGFTADGGLGCRVGNVYAIAMQWVSAGEARCATPAHAGARTSAISVASSVAEPPPSLGRPLAVRFTVSAELMDPRGRPGGRSIEVARRATNDANAAARASLRSTSPPATASRAPASLLGRELPSDADARRCWCVFGDALASTIVPVSSAVARCAESPDGASAIGGRAGEATSVRVGCGGGGGGDAGWLTLGVSRLPLTLTSPTVRAVRPGRVPAIGGVAATFTGSGFYPSDGGSGAATGAGADGDGEDAAAGAGAFFSFACRFGAIGPVAARHLSPREVSCATPATMGGRSINVGVAPDAAVAETAWGGDGVQVYVDDALTRSALDQSSAASAASFPPGGSARGGVAFELLHVARGSPPGSGSDAAARVPPRFVFGDASSSAVLGAWRGDAAAAVVAARCVTPRRFASGGFEAVRVSIDLGGAVRAFAAAATQFHVHADPRVLSVFPRLSWGAEVVHVSGEHLRPGGGAPSTACVFGGGASPSRAVSSTLITCEVAAGVEGGGAKAASAKKVAASAGASREEDASAVAVAAAASSSATAVRPVGVCPPGSECDDDGAGDDSLWFQSVAPVEPIESDVALGWTDGGTLTRLALTAPIRAEWLECRFGTTIVPSRPASAWEDPLAQFYGVEGALVRPSRKMDIECVSPGHAAGKVPIEVALGRSKVPSARGAVSFKYI